MTQPAVDNYLQGGGNAVSFGDLQAQPGNPLSQQMGMLVLEPATLQQQRDFNSKELKWWDKAETQPMMGMVITVQTQQRDAQSPDGVRRLFINSKSQREALAAGMRAANCNGAPQPGSVIDMAWTHNEQIPGTSKYERKYQARYTPPAGNFLNPADPFGGQPAAQAPPQQQAPAQQFPGAPNGQQFGQQPAAAQQQFQPQWGQPAVQQAAPPQQQAPAQQWGQQPPAADPFAQQQPAAAAQVEQQLAQQWGQPQQPVQQVPAWAGQPQYQQPNPGEVFNGSHAQAVQHVAAVTSPEVAAHFQQQPPPPAWLPNPAEVAQATPQQAQGQPFGAPQQFPPAQQPQQAAWGQQPPAQQFQGPPPGDPFAQQQPAPGQPVANGWPAQ